MSLNFTKPAAFHGGAFEDELAAAGFPDAEVSDNGLGELVIGGPAESDRDAIQALLDDHTPPSTPPDPDAELDAGLADAAAKPTVEEKVDAVIAALRGQAGREGRAAGRPT